MWQCAPSNVHVPFAQRNSFTLSAANFSHRQRYMKRLIVTKFSSKIQCAANFLRNWHTIREIKFSQPKTFRVTCKCTAHTKRLTASRNNGNLFNFLHLFLRYCRFNMALRQPMIKCRKISLFRDALAMKVVSITCYHRLEHSVYLCFMKSLNNFTRKSIESVRH